MKDPVPHSDPAPHNDPAPRDDPALAAVRRAVQAMPDDPALRLHLAQLLLDAGRADEAVTHAGQVLAQQPAHPGARELMVAALAGPRSPAPGAEPPPRHHRPEQPSREQPSPAPHQDPSQHQDRAPHQDPPQQPVPQRPHEPEQPGSQDTPAPSELPGTTEPPAAQQHSTEPGSFDWQAAESQLGDIARPMFLSGDSDHHAPDGDPGDDPTAAPGGGQSGEPSSAFVTERPTVTLADVGGMQGVKDRLYAAFLAPLRNPELQRLYGKSLRGGLLLYGPPGCGKTFLARALAGELGASFVSAGLAEILDMWVGASERNLHELFASVRRSAPCVLFLDEIDALGHKRSQAAAGAMRGSVNQLLTELDGVTTDNEGVFVLAATNQPWDVDPALRRPGRLDRTLLVLPPDKAAREAIFRYHLAHRPVEGIDLSALAAQSAGFSGADIAFVCEQATERALLDGARTGTARLIGMADLTAALRQTRPSTGPWLQTARTVVQYGQDDGTFEELKQYLKNAKRW